MTEHEPSSASIHDGTRSSVEVALDDGVKDVAGDLATSSTGAAGPRATAEVVPSVVRQPVIQLLLGQDERPDVSGDSEPPVVLDSYRADGRIMFELYKDGEVESKSLQDLLSDASAAHRATTPDYGPDPQAEILYWVPLEVTRKALKVQADLIDVIHGRPPGDPRDDDKRYHSDKTTIAERRKAKMAELGWSASTLSRRESAYRTRGIAGLIPHAGRKVDVRSVIDVRPEILALVREQLQHQNLGSKRDLHSLHASVIVHARRRRLMSTTPGTPGPDGNDLPTVDEALPYHRFVALYRQFNGGRNPLTAKTRHEQSKRPANGPLRHRAYHFGDMLEVDATPTDFFIRGDDGKPRRAYAVFATCVATKMTWLRLVQEPPRGRDLALLLFDILGGHSLSRAGENLHLSTVPLGLNLVNLYPPNAGAFPGVFPGIIRLDHGAEEENQLWISLCAQLSIELHWAATRNPTDKAYIESRIRDFAIVCQLFPSHKGNTVLNRPQFVSPESIPTFEQAERAFAEWPMWLANQPHTGLQVGTSNRYLTPLQAAHNSIRFNNPVRVLADPTVALSLLPTKHLTPQDDGVTWQRRRYWCEDYSDLIAAASRGGDRRKLVFFYDPQAKHRLYWKEPGTFNVRRLSSPGRDSGVEPAFDSVRRKIADILGYHGQPWPTPTQTGERRADLLELMQRSWSDDGINPDENVVPMRKRSGHRPTPKPAVSQEPIGNGGWRLEDFTAERRDDAVTTGDPRDASPWTGSYSDDWDWTGADDHLTTSSSADADGGSTE